MYSAVILMMVRMLVEAMQILVAKTVILHVVSGRITHLIPLKKYLYSL